MSVIKSKRGIAGSEFINTARELHQFSYQQCGKFPKTQTFRYGKLVVDAADRILACVFHADRIHIHTRHDAQARLDTITAAQAACDLLDTAIEGAFTPCSISYKAVERWAELLDKEERLLHGQEEYCRGKLREFKNSTKEK